MTDRAPAEPANDDGLLEDILRHATPRPKPSAAARERALRELRGEWRELTAHRRQRRRFFALAAVASFAIAVLVGLQWFNPAVSPAMSLQATVLRMDGAAILVNGERVAADAIADLALLSGDQLSTTANGHAAIGWGSGSLRLNAATTITLLDDQTISLARGAVYFDSQQFGNNTAASIVVRTAFAEITHVGTQFQAVMADEALTVQVREGAVDIKGPRVAVQLSTGEALQVSGSGDVRRAAIATNDPGWAWATRIAPELALDGRSTADVLNWIGRETGQRVVYRSNKARELADSEARGIGTLAPLPALRTIPYMTSLDYSIVDGVIAVDLVAAPPDPR